MRRDEVLAQMSRVEAKAEQVRFEVEVGFVVESGDDAPLSTLAVPDVDVRVPCVNSFRARSSPGPDLERPDGDLGVGVRGRVAASGSKSARRLDAGADLFGKSR